MKELLASLRHGLAGLGDFRGRDDARTFWPYTLLVVAVLASLWTFLTAPYLETLQQKVFHYAVAHPDQTSIAVGSNGVEVKVYGAPPGLLSGATPLIVIGGITALVAVVLLAAAIARRLRDRGRSPAWALLPLIFGGIGYLSFAMLFGNYGYSSAAAAFAFFSGFAYIVSGFVLILMLAGDSAA
jgi:uncharacterized membrane protein YhaH (DUF805 family)